MDAPAQAPDRDPWQVPSQAPSQAPSQVPWLPPAPGRRQSNDIAVWSWVVALPCALLGLVLGVVGLVRARQRGGAGLAHAVVGLVASGVVLVVGAGLAGAAAAGALGLVDLPGDDDGDGALASRGHDDTVTSLSTTEQAFIDGLYDETYDAHDDATLLAMGRGFCADLDTGSTPPAADAALVARWSGDELDLDAAYDVEWEATSSLCPAHAEEFDAWDPSATDAEGQPLTT